MHFSIWEASEPSCSAAGWQSSSLLPCSLARSFAWMACWSAGRSLRRGATVVGCFAFPLAGRAAGRRAARLAVWLLLSFVRWSDGPFVVLRNCSFQCPQSVLNSPLVNLNCNSSDEFLHPIRVVVEKNATHPQVAILQRKAGDTSRVAND